MARFRTELVLSRWILLKLTRQTQKNRLRYSPTTTGPDPCVYRRDTLTLFRLFLRACAPCPPCRRFTLIQSLSSHIHYFGCSMLSASPLRNNKRLSGPSINPSIRLCGVVLLSLYYAQSYAETINVDCETMAGGLIDELAAQGLLAQEVQTHAQAKRLALDSCANTEKSAQQQHEQLQTKALENWFFEYHPQKPGNRRLKKTH